MKSRTRRAASRSSSREVLQTAFGWKNSHVHDFRVGDIRFGMTGVEDEVFGAPSLALPTRYGLRRTLGRGDQFLES